MLRQVKQDTDNKLPIHALVGVLSALFCLYQCDVGLHLFIHPTSMLSGIALSSPRVILVGKKERLAPVFLAGINMRLISEPVYSCSHPKLTPGEPAHWTG
ncbi:UNVERIFIED_CONTAM: hypothetical protein C3P02_19430 [Clostridioides difficile]